MFGLTRWRRRRIITNHPLSDALWDEVVQRIACLRVLPLGEKAQLRDLATLFVHDKQFVGAAEYQPDDFARVSIAAQACLPALRTGFDRLEGWHEILIYPGQFRTRRDQHDEAGVVTEDMSVLSGEAASHGNMVLSWQDVVDDFSAADGNNVVIHEIAHKLDMENGAANGMPPLPRSMDPDHWSRAFTAAWDDLERRFEMGEPMALDSYALSAPEEFFAVACEVFFETPTVLRRAYPKVYEQMVRFFGLDMAIYSSA